MSCFRAIIKIRLNKSVCVRGYLKKIDPGWPHFFGWLPIATPGRMSNALRA
jgi:hypothetical protein